MELRFKLIHQQMHEKTHLVICNKCSIFSSFPAPVFCSPDFLLGTVLDHEVDEDGPQARALGVAAQHLVQHDLAFLHVAVPELQLGKLGNHVHIWRRGRGGGVRNRK